MIYQIVSNVNWDSTDDSIVYNTISSLPDYDNYDSVKRVSKFALYLMLLLPFKPLSYFIFVPFRVPFLDIFSTKKFIRTTLLLDESLTIKGLYKRLGSTGHNLEI